MKLLLPSIVFLAVLSIIPLVALLWMSVHEFGRIPTQANQFVGLQHYAEAISNDRLINSWKTTFIYVGASLLLQTVLGVVLAVSLDTIDRGENAFTSIIIMPMMIAPVAVGLIWQFLLSDAFGLYAFILHQIGLFTQQPVLANGETALPAVIIMDTWQWTPLVVLIVLARLKSIPEQLYEASRVDGATTLSQFRYVTLPMLKPAIAIALLLRSMDLMRYFAKVFITTGGGPSNSTKIIGFYVYQLVLRFFNLGVGSAAAIVMLAVTVLVGLVFVEAIMGGAGDG